MAPPGQLLGGFPYKIPLPLNFSGGDDDLCSLQSGSPCIMNLDGLLYCEKAQKTRGSAPAAGSKLSRRSAGILFIFSLPFLWKRVYTES
jgi:hypothetical protein